MEPRNDKAHFWRSGLYVGPETRSRFREPENSGLNETRNCFNPILQFPNSQEQLSRSTGFFYQNLDGLGVPSRRKSGRRVPSASITEGQERGKGEG